MREFGACSQFWKSSGGQAAGWPAELPLLTDLVLVSGVVLLPHGGLRAEEEHQQKPSRHITTAKKTARASVQVESSGEQGHICGAAKCTWAIISVDQVQSVGCHPPSHVLGRYHSSHSSIEALLRTKVCCKCLSNTCRAAALPNSSHLLYYTAE